MGRRRSLLVRLQDGSGTLSLRFFHFSQAQKEGLKRGTALRCYGEVRPGATGLEIYHPEYRAQSGDEPAPVEQSLTPIYPTTEGLTQQRLRQLSQQALARLGPRSLPDWLPDELARDYRLAPLDEAIRYLHRPPPDADVEELAEGRHWAQHRLAFEELLTHQLSLQRLREQVRAQQAPALPPAQKLPQQYLQNLGFAPTGAQQRVGAEIAYDLAQSEPMLRLVQGDVGAGKRSSPSSTFSTSANGWHRLAWTSPGWPASSRARPAQQPWNRSPAAARWWSAPTPCSRTR
jgi:ATP-dependent DNA helicase RecG